MGVFTCLAALLLAASPALAQTTAGGFGNGDPAAIPAFRRAAAAATAITRLPAPPTPGGMTALITSLLASTSEPSDPLPPDQAHRLQAAILQALDHPSATPAHLYFIHYALALSGADPVIVLVCEVCGTATLAMRAEGRPFVLSPQLDLKDLGLAPP